MRWVWLVAIALAAVAGGCLEGAATTATPRTTPAIPVARSFDSAPLASPTQLRGHLLYLPYDTAGCSIHSYDLAERSDVVVARLGRRCLYPPNFIASRDGRAVAWLGVSPHGLRLLEVGGGLLKAGPPNLRTGDYPTSATIGPVSSPDSREVAYCRKLEGTDVEWDIVDARTGSLLKTLPTCTAVFTARGIAELTDSGLLVDGKVVALAAGGPPTADAAYQLSATPAGDRIAVVSRTRDSRGQVRASVSIYSLDGALVARHALRGRLDESDGTILNFAIMRLSPHADSAMFWWGDISRLASFAAPGRFRLGLGARSEPVRLVAFSPDGRYAVMGRRAFALLGFGEPPATPPPLDAVIMNADTWQPLLRVPIHSEVVAWIA
jgi:hypothetical protein